MLTVDDKDLKKIAKNLKNAHKYALPDAVRSTLNSLAYKTANEYKKNVPQRLVSRNKGYLKTIAYENCDRSIKDIDRMESTAGQRSRFFGKNIDGLRKQEFGETIKAKGKHIVKPTKFARGGNYKRLVKKENLMSSIKVKRISDLVRYPAKGTAAQFRQVVAVAHRKHQTINFIPNEPTSRKKFGIFQMWDSGTVIKDGKPHAKGKAAKLLYSFKDKTQALNATPILKPAGEKIGAQSAEVFEHEAQRRIARELSKGLTNS